MTAAAVSTSGPAAMKWVAPNWRDRAAVGDGQTLQDVEPDAPDADHQRRLSGPGTGPVQHCACAGEHSAADEAGRGERHLGVDNHGLGLFDHGGLGEDPSIGELERLLSPHRERGAEATSGVTAMGGLTAVTGIALAAVAQGGEDDVVTHLHLADGSTDLFDHSRPLVAEHGRGRERDRAVDHRDVAVTQPGGVNPNSHLVGTQVPHLYVVSHLERTGPDNCFHRRVIPST